MSRCGGSWTVETIGPVNVLRDVRGVFCYRFRCAKCGRAKDQPEGGAAKAFARPCAASTEVKP